MKIGLTYDLRQEYLAAGYSEEETAEFDRPDTIDAIDEALRELGHTTDRIGNVRQLVSRLVAGDRWDLVFNICEGLRGRAREAQVPALLDAYDIPYTFSDPLVLALSLDKALTKIVVRAAGVATPDFAVVANPSDIARVELPFPLFAKPIGEGTGKGVTPASKISDAAALDPVCRELLQRFRQPVLVERFLSGREFTVGILGTAGEGQVVGTMEILLLQQAEAEVYSYVNKERSEELVTYRLGEPQQDAAVREAESLALAAWSALHCRDGGRVDIRCDEFGRPHFLEVNPLAGLHPFHSDLPIICGLQHISYRTLIERIVQSASMRVVARVGSPGVQH
ncbi:MAG: D-alanine--D-alanine ligase [Pirellulaceae bacterium]